MILIAAADKPFEYTPKHSVKRQAVLKSYAREIEELYAAKDASSLAISRPENWHDVALVLDFVRRVVEEVMIGGEDIKAS